MIGGERGNLDLANLNYLQQMKFLRSFVGASRRFDFIVLDLAPGIRRQALDFALFADRTIIVTSLDDLMSAYGSARGCLFRFIELETTLFQRIDGYTARRFFRPFILTNHVTNLYQGKAAFETLKNAAEKKLNNAGDPFGITMGHLGSVFHDPELFRKSEERHCPVSLVSDYSKVAICIDAMATTICGRSPFRGFYQEERLCYIIQILMEKGESLRKGITPGVMKIPPVRIPFHH